MMVHVARKMWKKRRRRRRRGSDRERGGVREKRKRGEAEDILVFYRTHTLCALSTDCTVVILYPMHA